jgi:hypothetical protein
MKKRLNLLLAMAMVVTVASCMQSPEGEKVETGNVFKISEYNQGKELKIELDNSSIEWLGTKPTGTHFGTLGIIDGSIFVKNGKILGGRITMDMNAIVVQDIENQEMNKNLVGHLKSADFFLVDSFPTATFEFSKVVQLNDNHAEIDGIMPTHQLYGNLTLRGVTRGISFTAKIDLNDGSINAVTPQFLINRTNWNVSYGSKSIFAELKDNFIHDEMGIIIKLKAK